MQTGEYSISVKPDILAFGFPEGSSGHENGRENKTHP